MKILLLLQVLCLLALGYGALIKAPTSRTNLNVGYVTSGDKLLHRVNVYQPPIANAIQYQDVVYRGNFTTWISAVQATEVGATQYATPWIIAGGIGYNNVTVRVQSALGYGYYYWIDIWGR
ncbi:uncharacterized protein LOC131849843 [Achroia grisella]|uniref:uncharacterized protein LOC131849843 n=1 Tax=Achroia grisella TaxID=688607 RepID=UPI0027D203D3|nr:uncharacterized protein LOC131849843 [Achroia grisella]